jgi:signal peptidase I
MKLWRCFRGSAWLASAACIGYTFNQCVASPWRLTGDSMMPAFSNGQLVLCSPWPWCCRRLQRGDVIVARHPNQPQEKICKRILGAGSKWFLLVTNTCI